MIITRTQQLKDEYFTSQVKCQGIDPEEKPKPGDGDETVNTEEEEDEGDIRPLQ